jgi:hypothetical protein
VYEPEYINSINLAVYALLSRGTFEMDNKLYSRDGKAHYGQFYVIVVQMWFNFMFLMKNDTFLFLIFYMLLSFLGYIINPFFYAFLLLDVIVIFNNFT